MASSFIEYKTYGFWAQDGFVEAMQSCLINEITLQGLDEILWVNLYKEELALQSLPLIYGGISMQIDEFLINNERKTLIIKVIDKIIKKIEEGNLYISNANLNKMRREALEILYKNGSAFKNKLEIDNEIKMSRWRGDSCVSQYKDRYIVAFQLLKQLIKEELKQEVSYIKEYW